MKIIWPVIRYARCYTDSSKQCMDAERRVAIFQYFSHLETQRAQSFGNYWSAINQTAEWNMIIEITTSSKGSCELNIRLKHDQTEIVLVGKKHILPVDAKIIFRSSSIFLKHFQRS